MKLRGEICKTMESKTLKRTQVMNVTLKHELPLQDVDVLSIHPPTIGYTQKGRFWGNHRNC